MRSDLHRARPTASLLLCITLASLLSAGCVSRPINIQSRLIDCPGLVPDTLRTTAEASAAPEPDSSIGGWVDFAQQTEAARLNENRDKLTVDQLYRRCHGENVRINTPERRRLLGIF